MPDRPAILRRKRALLRLSDVALHRVVALIGHYDNVRADSMLSPHRHPELLEICYLARGRQVYRVAGRDYAIRAGEVFLTFPGEQHSTGGRPQEKGELFWLQVRLSQRKSFLGLSRRDSRPLLQALQRLPRRHFVASEPVGRLFERLLPAAAARPHPLKRLEVTALVLELLLEVRRCAGRHKQPPLRDAALQELLDYMQQHVERPAAIAELSARMNLSPSWFKARFRRAMGIPPAEYLQRVRVQRAQSLLQQGVSVTEVAMRLGFSSSQYFATVYRRFFDRSPSQER